MPPKIIQTILSEYIFSDIYGKFPRFFKPSILNETEFVELFSRGLMPRKFNHDDSADSIIFEENQDVSEMYFFQEGSFSIGINSFSHSQRKILYTNGKEDIVGDYYVLHGKRSNFIYLTTTSVSGFAINRFYLMEEVLKNFGNIKN